MNVREVTPNLNANTNFPILHFLETHLRQELQRVAAPQLPARRNDVMDFDLDSRLKRPIMGGKSHNLAGFGTIRLGRRKGEGPGLKPGRLRAVSRRAESPALPPERQSTGVRGGSGTRSPYAQNDG